MKVTKYPDYVEYDYGNAIVRIHPPKDEKKFYENLTHAASQFYTAILKAEERQKREGGVAAE